MWLCDAGPNAVKGPAAKVITSKHLQVWWNRPVGHQVMTLSRVLHAAVMRNKSQAISKEGMGPGKQFICCSKRVRMHCTCPFRLKKCFNVRLPPPIPSGYDQPRTKVNRPLILHSN